MRRTVIGILAHVDAGKTTLSEAMLFKSGSIRKMGRVDNQDAFLDTYALERTRGITIFSKQAQMSLGDLQVTLLDTPGHVDFSAEMERTLQVLDYAILVISGADGVQGHTQTLWRLLARYQIPVFLFINKMDQEGTDSQKLLAELKSRLDDGCIDFGGPHEYDFYESLAMCDERALEHFLEHETLESEDIRSLISARRVFPCFFGSALKLTGVEEFLTGLVQYTETPCYPEAFGARVFKIARDDQGSRLTYLKVTGGSLKTKTSLTNRREGMDRDTVWEEKINQIRIYSGEKYETVSEAAAGMICAVTGLTVTRPGMGFGIEEESIMPILEPVLTYQMILDPSDSVSTMLPRLRQLEEEEPQLHIVWDENLQEIQAQVMGEVQTEVLQSLIKERFGADVKFGAGNIVYKETIADKVEGVGHFEPLRHYAEVHLILEPGEAGSGLVFESSCSEDVLDRNWQRLILTHLEEKEHRGVLTGSAITDMKITLAAGRAHKKHTEGGDFRQATYRAVRHGLKRAVSVLLEPFYEYRLEVPSQMTGRAMADLERMHGTFRQPVSEGGLSVLTGSAPVSAMRGYSQEVVSYTKGHGRLFCSLQGYGPCHNAEEVILRTGYDSEHDLENPTGSVFCAHGAGFVVNWDQVEEYMHLEPQLIPEGEKQAGESREAPRQYPVGAQTEEPWIDTEEVDAILAKAYGANQKGRKTAGGWKQRRSARTVEVPVPGKHSVRRKLEEYLLVDGYNIIFAWEDLKELAQVNIDGARGKLLDILSNYQAIRRCHLIVVFDAYRVGGHTTEIMEYHNIHVVYTKEAETADQYIERFAHENREKYQVVVATSDGLEQIIIRGQGCGLLSARDLQEEIREANAAIQEQYLKKQRAGRNYLLDGLSEEEKKKLGQEE
ncbi:TetM/TetW/TetO/TetS family tetracycline resistance ribosomal protection protein [Ruminococcus sp. OA3]|uniref:translation factor GTPase family protein n=1 Tax=Ruminococcus sp. OA3 TaxID=2914164 RepID=UPI001F067100|nr:TetM/TetW/TetO/TetS family tetracycline resistance ribosomal protection protein [Ruminococcus sp. OA3]MCH1981740.1 TetM/TetW/TetO/TetS family tetracycline resistance ribosomal protection protein [Ruminococcus sp. OA3]